MPAPRKRKGSTGLADAEESAKRRFAELSGQTTQPESADGDAPPTNDKAPDDEPQSEVPPETPQGAPEIASAPAQDRMARFAALRARNQASRKSNLQETKNEAKRVSTDYSQLSALNRKKEIAAHKLLKADVEDAGEDFERKRAWDWTIEESERWDARQAQKASNRENNVFADYSQEAEKVYSRQVAHMEKKGGMDERREAYEAEKAAAAIERAIQSGGLEIVEMKNGELIAVDKDGSFYSTTDHQTSLPGNKPSRAAVDRLVDDIKKAEEARLKKRRDRGAPEAEGINEKNKQFNLKLARFYDKYTADIRQSFERGTAV